MVVTQIWTSLAHPMVDNMPRAREDWPCSFVMTEHPVSEKVVGHLTDISIKSHTGTHIDAPLHVMPGTPSLDQYPPDKFCGSAVVFSVHREGPVEVTADELRAADPGLRPGEMAFISMGYGARFNDPDYGNHPYLTVEAAEYLVDRGASIVGFDVVSPDMPLALRPDKFEYPVHVEFLRNDVLVMENIGPKLAHFEGKRIEVVMAPLPIAGVDGSPVVPLVRVID